MTRLSTLALLAFALTGCSAATWQAVGEGLQAASAGYSGAGLAPAGVKIMLFGGPGHSTYLGCLNCSTYETDSVFNTYGTHGSSYSSQSIFNKYGEFGSKYGAYSACNPYASDPPVIVDTSGNFYGRLTVNQYAPQATTNATLRAWLAGVCGG